MTTTVDLHDLDNLVGKPLGHTDWTPVTQDQVNLFAEATGDHQWIHVDPERAADGPFGGPIAHGYLTLSLVIPMWADLLTITGVGVAVNYGLNKVRFVSPVRVGSNVRLAATVAEAKPIKGGYELVVDGTVELEGSERPACALQAVFRYLAESS